MRKPQLPLLLGVLGAAVVVAWCSGTFRLPFPSSGGWLPWHRTASAGNAFGPGRPGTAGKDDLPVRRGRGYYSLPRYPNGLPAVFPRVAPPGAAPSIEISGAITPCDKPVKVSLTRGRNDGRGVNQKDRLATVMLPPGKTKYAFAKVPYKSDGYGVAFEAEGYAVDHVLFFVKAGEASKVPPVTMVPCGRMEGRIFPDPGKLGPFPVAVAAMLDDGRESFPVTASLDGKRGPYTIAGLKPGVYRLCAATLMGTSVQDQRAAMTEVVWMGHVLRPDERQAAEAVLEARMHPERFTLDQYDSLFAPTWRGWSPQERSRRMRATLDNAKAHAHPPAPRVVETIAAGRRDRQIHLLRKATATNPVTQQPYVTYSRVVLSPGLRGGWQLLRDQAMDELRAHGAAVKIITAPSADVLRVQAGRTTEGPTIDISDWK